MTEVQNIAAANSPVAAMESHHDQLLFASDFDGTKFLTSELGKGILTVSDAYAEGIDTVLGAEYADAFTQTGGHHHRTPAEIVADLCPDMTQSEVENISVALIAAKISLLTEQIGKPLHDGALWPRPTDGLVSLWEQVSDHNDANDNITTAELSAGHTPFIKKTYDVHGLEQPDLILTDDFLVDELDMGAIPAQKRAKPETLLLEVASALWLKKIESSSGEDALTQAKGSTIYTGDSIEKDGGLAQNYGVTFVLLDPEHSIKNWNQIGRWLQVGNLSINGATRQMTPNWYVITGGPSCGKTTTLAELEKLGYATLPEAARVVIDEGIAAGSTIAQIRKDEIGFQDKVLKRKVDVENTQSKNALTFFDRGMHDTKAYLQMYDEVLTPEQSKAIKNAQYKAVFLLDPLLKFENDYARTEDKEFTKKITGLLRQAYEDYTITVITVPILSPKKRAQFILEKTKKITERAL